MLAPSRFGPRHCGQVPGRFAGWPSERMSLPAKTGLVWEAESAPGAWSVPGTRRAKDLPGPRPSHSASAARAATASATGISMPGFANLIFFINAASFYRDSRRGSSLTGNKKPG